MISKVFIVMFLLSAIVGYETKSLSNFFAILALYIVPRIIYNLFKNG